MGNGIILRVLEDTELSPEVTRTLEKLLPDHKIEYFKSKPRYRHSIENRINSLYDAFLFILKAYPPNPTFTSINVETLRAYAEECRKACDLKKSTLSELHKELEKFTGSLVDVLAKEWDWSDSDPEKEAIACLNEAEQYMLMQRGRQDIATLTPLKTETGEIKFVLQYDKSLSPIYPLLVQELEGIKGAKYPKTPQWFRELKQEYQQVYFSNLKIHPISPKTIRQDLNQLLLKWKTAKTTSLNLLEDLNRIKNNKTPLPLWFETFSPGQKELFRFLATACSSAKEIDTEIDSFKKQISELASNKNFESTVRSICKLPLWYWTLSEKQQYFLEYVLSNSETIEEAFSFVPSRHRTLPLPANYGSHSLFMLNKSGEVKLFFNPRYRSSHVSSRDILKQPQAVQQRHVVANLEKVMEFATDKQSLLLQTLISPITAFDYVPDAVWDYLPEPPPDLELFRIARSAIERHKRSANFVQPNHPFNIAKRCYYTLADDKESLALIAKAKLLVSVYPELEALIHDYKAVLESSIGTATIWDYDGRELFLSSLEQLIILTMNGYSYGSCVSGKDRKAIELIHTDAMILYKELYGVWPKFGDPKEKQDRVKFVNLVAMLYVSRHQQELAGQNAPGSEGIKTPEWYWPADIVEAIKTLLNDKDALRKDDRLATDNEVKNISKDLGAYMSKGRELHCFLIAKQLGEKLCTDLYDSLSSLINEENQFKTKSTSWSLKFYDKESSSNTPTGIRKIAKVMSDEKSGNDNVHRMSKIFEIVLERPEEDDSRLPATNSVYNGIRTLLDPLEQGATLQGVAAKLITNWNSLFDNSKRERREFSLFQ
ncbi:hypothetical protein [Legionella waltersii]|uniref:Oxidoreductase n=1 Tax=Legionella waltersii TaxID=66969 RepID=A0A0W1A5M3_9GAMM|nr:hypothetical protein [Legionella waltersii]KTD76639.1 oxidoreductase [Legionella waltersii]SNU94740.1 oxidoreductase [Legionella waltersii]